MYLDQWVWIRLRGLPTEEPREAYDLRVLAAVQGAAAEGMAFPLSTIHHIETSKITSPRQQMDVARTMAAISHCCTLRARKVLLRHQMVHAMHLTFGRPAFRPQPPEVLGTGFRWAFDGVPGHGVLRGLDGAVVDSATIEGMPEFLRKANQFTEMMLLAGPGDEEIGELREHYGYRPEAMDSVEADRLEWEVSYVEILTEHPASKAELRVRLQARGLIFEHKVMFQALLGEYRINLNREGGYNPGRPNVSRRRMVACADAVPSLRIAVELKVELFRGAAKPWNMNAVHDIDALSKAVPYCPSSFRTARWPASCPAPAPQNATGHRSSPLSPGCQTHYNAWPSRPGAPPGDRTGWEWAGPWDDYCLDWSELADSPTSQPPAA